MINTVQESKNTSNISLNGSQKTKSNSTSSDVSTIDLMMSTSVPIKIGAEYIQHDENSIKSTKRIRYTFGLRKATAPENRLSSEHSPKRNEQVDSNSNDESMESLYLNPSITVNGFSNIKKNGTASLPATFLNSDHELNRSQIQFTQSKSQKKRLVKKTIDFYV